MARSFLLVNMIIGPLGKQTDEICKERGPYLYTALSRMS